MREDAPLPLVAVETGLIVLVGIRSSVMTGDVLICELLGRPI